MKHKTLGQKVRYAWSVFLAPFKALLWGLGLSRWL